MLPPLSLLYYSTGNGNALCGHGCNLCFIHCKKGILIKSIFKNPNLFCGQATDICHKDAETKTRRIRISLTIFICVFECFYKSGGGLGVWSAEQCFCGRFGTQQRDLVANKIYLYISVSPSHCRSRTPIIPRKQNISPLESYHLASLHLLPFSDDLNVLHASSAPKHLSLNQYLLCPYSLIKVKDVSTNDVCQ